MTVYEKLSAQHKPEVRFLPELDELVLFLAHHAKADPDTILDFYELTLWLMEHQQAADAVFAATLGLFESASATQIQELKARLGIEVVS